MDQLLTTLGIVIPIIGVIAILYAFVLTARVSKAPAGNDRTGRNHRTGSE